jgi:hypothetical protein
VNLAFYDRDQGRTRGTNRPYLEHDEGLEEMGVNLDAGVQLVEDSHARINRKIATAAQDDRFQPGKFLMLNTSDDCPWWLCQVLQRPQRVAVPGQTGLATQVLVQWWHPMGGSEPHLYNAASMFEPALLRDQATGTRTAHTDMIDLGSLNACVNVHKYGAGANLRIRVPKKYLER